jgi:hypothetical protein
MKTKLIFALSLSVALLSCTPSTEQRVEKAENQIERDIKKEKDETIRDLQTLRDDINAKLDKITKKLGEPQTTTKTELESVKEVLITNRVRVEKALDKIDNAADDSWDDIHQTAKNTVSEVSLDCERIAERFEAAVKNTDN